MWKTVTGERNSSGGRAKPQAATELSSLALSCQDSPLLGLLSAVSRPAVSFLQRWSPLVSGRSLKQDLVEQQSEFLQQLDVLPPQQLHSLPWFNLSELGISSLEGPQIQQTLQDPPGLQVPTLMGHVLLHPAPGGVANTWLSGLWSGAEDERLKPTKAGLFTSGMDQTLPPPRLSHHLPPGLLHSLGLGALSPDLDNGYSSLEEEQLQAAKAQLQAMSSTATEEPAEEEEQEEEQEDVPVLKCENKAIAFIMGCPCSDDSGSDSDEDDDDDDGFNSVCSSEISDSDNEEEEEEVEELDSEAERLWSALCQNHDPYNPRNFTAKLGSMPRPIPRSGPAPETSPSSVDSSPSSSSSSSSSSSWDEASETEQETMKLLTAFCSSDPYSPLNFQASIRTKPKGLETKPDPKVDPDPEEGRVRTSSESSHSSSRATRKKKKQVRFQAEVLVFAVGCEERRGPWEELARDRARFAKRCSDIEQILSSYLQPEHRRRVYLRISQSEREEERREEAAGQSERD